MRPDRLTQSDSLTPPRPPLRRSDDQMIAGVVAGLAEYLGWPADRTRVAYILVSVLSAGFPGVLVYLVLWAVMPPPDSRELRFELRDPSREPR